MEQHVPTPVALEPYCPVFQRTLELIGKRWSGAIIRTMLTGSHRFNDILASVPGLSDRLLSERLRELEANGIVLRTVHPDVPVRIEYTLAEKGQHLLEVVEAVAAWAERWGGPVSDQDVPGEP